MGRNNRARMTRGSQSPTHDKGKHYNVHKASRENTREHKILPRNVENATCGGDKRRNLTPRARKHGNACGPWRG
jgi:hypothetical protein